MTTSWSWPSATPETIGAGHSFVVLLEGGYPVSVLNALKQVPEVCGIYCATANPVEILVAETVLGRGIVGVVDGMPPAGVETETESRAQATAANHRLQALSTVRRQDLRP